MKISAIFRAFIPLCALFLLESAGASIISTETSVGMSIRYRDQSNAWFMDASGSDSSSSNASIDITGSKTGVRLYSDISANIYSPYQVAANFSLGREGEGSGAITTSAIQVLFGGICSMFPIMPILIPR